MFRKVAKTWNRNILKLHIVTPCTLQQRQKTTYYYLNPETSLRENCKPRNHLNGRDVPEQHIRTEWATQKRDHGTHLNVPYPETPISKHWQDFPYTTINSVEKMGTKKDINEFMSTLPEVLHDLINVYTDFPILSERYAQLLNYTVGKDKQASGFLAVAAYKMFADPGDLNPENIKLANILGWCVNVLLCAYQVADDIMDASEYRFGEPCWYKRKGVSMQAINDAMLMEDGVQLLLKKYFSGHKCYLPIAEWFHYMRVKILVGQTLDNICDADGRPPLNLFTQSTHDYIVKHKGTYPVFTLPVVSGIVLADKYNKEVSKQTDAILDEIGWFFTSENDMLDCFANPVVYGKVGTDILKGKCSWLIVKALELATPVQKQILNEHYGRFEHESEAEVRALFDELGILDEFLKFAENSFNKVSKLIQQVPNEMHRKFFYKTAEATYGRKL